MVGFLIEHYAGKFPVWLSPEQVRIVPITESHHDYARQLRQRLQAAGIRVEADLGSDRMNAKIRQAQLMQIPYMLVVGDNEMAGGTVSLRRRDNTRQNDLPVEAFIATVQDRIATRSGEL
jgi:threonyl-tRNA synthetase